MPKPDEYSVNLTKSYKIWFSKDPDCFLGQENQLRLVRLRALHPWMQIALVYSKQALRPHARKALLRYCEKNNILPVDFDAVYKNCCLETPVDTQLAYYVDLEIKNTLNNQGGNLAAASDCIRFFDYFMKNYGFYSDFDVEINVTSFQNKNPYVKHHAPMLFMGDFFIERGRPSLLVNNDFFSVAYTLEGSIHAKTIKKIKSLKEQILLNYTKPVSLLFSEKTFIKQSKIAAYLFNFFIEKFPEDTIFSYRKYVENLSHSFLLKTLDIKNSIAFNTQKAQELAELKHFMYIPSVMCLTGSHMLCHVFLKNKDISFFKEYVMSSSPLNKHVFSKNSRKTILDFAKDHSMKNKQVGDFCDFSWTPLGEIQQKTRLQALEHAASTFQKYWRQRQQQQTTKQETLIKPRLPHI